MGEKEPSLKSERRKCYEARDQYTSCVEKFLNQGKSEQEAANSCRSERKGFDNNCPASWVNHFIRKSQFERYKEQLSKQGYSQSVRFCSVQIREISPAFGFINFSDCPPNYTSHRPLINEVLRCNAYINDKIFERCIKILEDESNKLNSDGMIMTKMKFFSIAYHTLKDEKKKTIMKGMAEKLEKTGLVKCKSPLFRRETELFAQSLKSSEDEPSSIPNFDNCLNPNELAQCFFHREMKYQNWKNLRFLIEKYGSIDAYAFTKDILEVAENRKIGKFEVFDLFMKIAERNNRYFLDEDDYNKYFENVFKFCGVKVNKINENDQIITKEPKKFVSNEDLKKLIDSMDKMVRAGNQGVIKTKEVEKAVIYVKKWKERKNIKDGGKLVVVDALNFGGGKDPAEWTQIKNEYKHVFFSSRTPPVKIRQQIYDRYKGSAIFCDKLSADDLIVLRIAWEFGPQAVVVTNDLYRDHRDQLCRDDEDLRRIWDDWAADALYRHDFGKPEPHRHFNLRIRQLSDSWIIPVVQNSPRVRKINLYQVASPPSDVS